jgi:hypothetical protein
MPPIEQEEHFYEKPADMLHVDISPDPDDNLDMYVHRKKFWMQRRRGNSHLTIGFPEPGGFIAREVKIEDLQEALEELENYEDEE